MGNTNPWQNQSEQGTPQTSQWGQTLKANILSTVNDFRVVPKPTYLFRGFAGDGIARAAKVFTIFSKGGYGGEFPIDQQPFINKPLPYVKKVF